MSCAASLKLLSLLDFHVTRLCWFASSFSDHSCLCSTTRVYSCSSNPKRSVHPKYMVLETPVFSAFHFLLWRSHPLPHFELTRQGKEALRIPHFLNRAVNGADVRRIESSWTFSTLAPAQIRISSPGDWSALVQVQVVLV